MTATILVVDDEENARVGLANFLTTRGYEVIGAGTLQEARHAIDKGLADIVLLDVNLPDGYGPNLLLELADNPSRPPIILITAYADIDMAVEAMNNGAFYFHQKPVQLNLLARSIQRASEIVAMRRELNHMRNVQYPNFSFIVGKTPRMLAIVNQAQRAAMASVSVLITGETGTGKEILAKFVHLSGNRSNKPFIDINCAAIQNTMLESELFGHEAGAFTSAEKRKNGLMEIADGGILFLDEISSMSLDIQAKLLRAIEEQSFRRVGGTTSIKVDVQIIAASNRDLTQMINENQFRQDLYYRLKVVDLDLPPLRERQEDIPELVGHFIRYYNRKMGVNITDIMPRALEALINYHWPGNVRQLAHAIESAMLFCDDPSIDLQHLPQGIYRR